MITREEYLNNISEYVIRLCKKHTQLLNYLTEKEYLLIASEARDRDLQVVSEDIKIIVHNFLTRKKKKK